METRVNLKVYTKGLFWNIPLMNNSIFFITTLLNLSLTSPKYYIIVFLAIPLERVASIYPYSNCRHPLS